MTQAPTPGPLTSMPTVDLTDDMLFKIETGETVAWGEIKRRLAPTAPVEASGSERWTEDMERERREADYERGFRHGQESRPQPSGETREQVAHEINDYLNERFPDGPMPDGVQLFADPDDHTDAAMKHEAGCFELAGRILSLIRPAPLASGGQHSGGEDLERQLKRLQDAFPKAISNGIGRGMAMSAAMVAPSDPVIAEQILYEAGMTTEKALEDAQVMSYDIRKLKPVLRNIAERKGK